MKYREFKRSGEEPLKALLREMLGLPTNWNFIRFKFTSPDEVTIKLRRTTFKQERIMKAIIWSTMGDILKQCKSSDEAEEFIKESGWTELDRTYKGDDVNIVVLEF